MSPTSPRSGLQIAHTAELSASALKAGRALLDHVFGAEMTDHDWEHALGGVHALVWESGQLVLEVSAPLDCSGELTCDWREGDVW